MRQLTLLRHGRAEGPGRRYEDFDRPLDPVGLAEVQAAAAQIAALPHPPTLCLASPALRTLQTARVLVSALGLAPQALKLEQRLYLATPQTLRAVLAELAAEAPRVLLVGHNPGLSELAGALAATPGEVSLGTGRWIQCPLP